MPRFFTDQVAPELQTVILSGQHAAHAKVLRLKIGDYVTLCDGAGTDYSCSITEITRDQVYLTVKNYAPAVSEPAVSVSVYMAFSKGDKMEHVFQKATELGAGQLIAFPSSRCVSKMDLQTIRKKLIRWQKIAESAAEQSGRGRIPQVTVLESFQGAVNQAACADQAILFYENERCHTLTEAMQGTFQTVALMTGPEGGFTEEEVMQAEHAGMQICTLGRRILRCETAPLCALSAVMYASGEY